MSTSFNDFYNECMRIRFVDKIASFFEQEENWRALKDCWLESGHSDGLRELLARALSDVDFGNMVKENEDD